MRVVVGAGKGGGQEGGEGDEDQEEGKGGTAVAAVEAAAAPSWKKHPARRLGGCMGKGGVRGRGSGLGYYVMPVGLIFLFIQVGEGGRIKKVPLP